MSVKNCWKKKFKIYPTFPITEAETMKQMPINLTIQNNSD